MSLLSAQHNQTRRNIGSAAKVRTSASANVPPEVLQHQRDLRALHEMRERVTREQNQTNPGFVRLMEAMGIL